jgi:hypothetical protein
MFFNLKAILAFTALASLAVALDCTYIPLNSVRFKSQDSPILCSVLQAQLMDLSYVVSPSDDFRYPPIIGFDHYFLTCVLRFTYYRSIAMSLWRGLLWPILHADK